jgi:hypothetical protein
VFSNNNNNNNNTNRNNSNNKKNQNRTKIKFNSIGGVIEKQKNEFILRFMYIDGWKQILLKSRSSFAFKLLN